jgi:hypothetical protein
MLKYLAGLFLVFGLALYVSVQDGRTTPQSTQKNAELNKGTLASKADENHSQENVAKPERNAPRWYRLFRWPDGTTTWVIVLTLMAIAEQAKETAKATKAVRDGLPLQKASADAALLNAQALINAERPWIIVTAKRKDDNDVFMVYGELQGRTPAKIISGWGNHIIVPEILGERSTAIDNLPDEPPYKPEGTEIPYEILAVPGQTPFSIYVFPVYTRIKPNFELWRKIENFEEVLFLFGRLVYTDTLTKDPDGKPTEHETRWCFKYIPSKPEGMITKSGKPSYNRYT